MTPKSRVRNLYGKTAHETDGYNFSGSIISDLTGNVTGNVTGDVTGNLTGTATSKTPVVAVSADGAISIPSGNTIYMITKSASGAAMTIVDPTATTHDGLVLTFVSTTARAHSLDNSAGSGFFSSGGSSKDVGTFGGAIGDGFSIIAYQGKWYIDPRGVTNVTLG